MLSQLSTFLWQYIISKPPTPRKRVIIDLDETLIFLDESYIDRSLNNRYTHLTKITNFSYLFYLIYKEETASFFNELLAMQGVEISFMTAGGHEKEILKAIEQGLGLKSRILFDNCLFMNKVHPCSKGYKIRELIDKNIFNKDDFILLLDDNKWQLDSAQRENFATVQATGFIMVQENSDQVSVDCNSNYLEETLIKVREAKITLANSIVTVAPRY